MGTQRGKQTGYYSLSSFAVVAILLPGCTQDLKEAFPKTITSVSETVPLPGISTRCFQNACENIELKEALEPNIFMDPDPTVDFFQNINGLDGTPNARIFRMGLVDEGIRFVIFDAANVHSQTTPTTIVPFPSNQGYFMQILDHAYVSATNQLGLLLLGTYFNGVNRTYHVVRLILDFSSPFFPDSFETKILHTYDDKTSVVLNQFIEPLRVNVFSKFLDFSNDFGANAVIAASMIDLSQGSIPYPSIIVYDESINPALFCRIDVPAEKIGDEYNIKDLGFRNQAPEIIGTNRSPIGMGEYSHSIRISNFIDLPKCDSTSFLYSKVEFSDPLENEISMKILDSIEINGTRYISGMRTMLDENSLLTNGGFLAKSSDFENQIIPYEHPILRITEKPDIPSNTELALQVIVTPMYPSAPAFLAELPIDFDKIISSQIPSFEFESIHFQDSLEFLNSKVSFNHFSLSTDPYPVTFIRFERLDFNSVIHRDSLVLQYH